jgi:hypothetical protein
VPDWLHTPFHPRFSAAIDVATLPRAREMFVLAVAEVDPEFAAQALPRPAVAPQSHWARARTEAGWTADIAGHRVRGRRVWTSAPLRFRVIHAGAAERPGMPADAGDGDGGADGADGASIGLLAGLVAAAAVGALAALRRLRSSEKVGPVATHDAETRGLNEASPRGEEDAVAVEAAEVRVGAHFSGPEDHCRPAAAFREGRGRRAPPRHAW